MDSANRTSLSRRSFMKWSAAAAGIAATSGLVACQPAAQSEETKAAGFEKNYEMNGEWKNA